MAARAPEGQALEGGGVAGEGEGRAEDLDLVEGDLGLVEVAALEAGLRERGAESDCPGLPPSRQPAPQLPTPEARPGVDMGTRVGCYGTGHATKRLDRGEWGRLVRM